MCNYYWCIAMQCLIQFRGCKLSWKYHFNQKRCLITILCIYKRVYRPLWYFLNHVEVISLLRESLPDPMVIKLSSMTFVLIFQKTQSRKKHHSDWFQGSPLFLCPSLYCFLLFALHEWLWSWSYGSLIYNYLCNQCLSPLKLWVRISLRQDKVCQWLVKGRLFLQVLQILEYLEKITDLSPIKLSATI